MDIRSYIDISKKKTADFLTDYLTKVIIPEMSSIARWGPDSARRLLTLATKGKMLRATLLYLSYDCFAKNQDHEKELLTAAASLELFQTGILIQDDVMDQDNKRRGLISMHGQYQDLFLKDTVSDPKRTGESFAVCVGDLAYFSGYHLLSSLANPYLKDLCAITSSELAKVTIAQMQDVYGGVSARPLAVDDILSVYQYKTGRYTCGLPLVLGATLASAPEVTIKNLWKLGISLGILFQIRDDELNLFGNPKETGKPVGSDIREGKQTLYRYYLLQKSEGKAKNRLQSLFGNHTITEEEMLSVIQAIKDLKIQKEIQPIINHHMEIIQELLTHIPMKPTPKALLTDLVSYILKRAV